MLACVIFNPTARGEKADRFRRLLSDLGPDAVLRPTTGPGTARALARQAVESGHERIIAAGGDGTVFEVLNGIFDVPDGPRRAALGVLPLGTANVFAFELGLPAHPRQAWDALVAGRISTIDCARASFVNLRQEPETACFAAVAGAGLDARAVQLVAPGLKRRFGKLAYIAAALQALLRHPDTVQSRIGDQAFSGRAVLAGNGRLYAGQIPVFADGHVQSGQLHIRGVRTIGPALLARCLVAYLTGRWTLDRQLASAAMTELHLEAHRPTPLQLDGEFVGWLPATLSVLPRALRVILPGTPSSPHVA